jgi:hypothetical protein
MDHTHIEKGKSLKVTIAVAASHHLGQLYFILRQLDKFVALVAVEV